MKVVNGTNARILKAVTRTNLMGTLNFLGENMLKIIFFSRDNRVVSNELK